MRPAQAAPLAALLAVILTASPALAAAPPRNVDISHRAGNESEEAVAVNPTNPNNIVVITNIAEGFSGLFEGVSFDGGRSWTTRIIADGQSETDPNVPLGDSCCDPSLSFDQYGNLFFSYLYDTETDVPVALSTDGGLSFRIVAEISKPSKTPGERTGTFRFTDQETITTGHNEVWIVFNAGGPIVATGAPVTGLGRVGTFTPTVVVPGTNNCTYGDVAIGPDGQVMNVCTLTESGQGGGKIYVNVDPDGLGPAPFADHSTFVADTHVGGFDFIPAQPDRSIDAEPGLAWDRSGGPHNGRVYLIYTLEVKNESDNTDIMEQYSDDNGVTWSTPVRVNDDATVNSQFLPKISLDQTTGHIAVTWYDARNDVGKGGSGDIDGIANTDAQFWGAFSADGTSFTPNFQISAGTSHVASARNGIDYGDYSGLSFFGGVAHPAWSDNSNSAGTNPDGALSRLDIYTAAVLYPR